MAAPAPLRTLCLLLAVLTGAYALKVTIRTSLETSLRGQAVILSCNIIDLDSTAAIAVTWFKKMENGTEKDVYAYDNGHVKVIRTGSNVVEREILKGVADLHISNVQFSDEGEYVCSVLNTPNAASGKVTLEVSAQPSVTLTPGDVAIEQDTEKSVTCDVTNVYPQTVTIRWVRYTQSSPSCLALEKGTCTADPTTNPDGTFSITSQLTLNPKKEDDGSAYGCVVTHRSVDHKIARNFTLTVTEKEDHTGTIVGAMIGTLLCTLAVVACVLYYLMRFKKDPPTLSAITGNDELTDMSRATLTCQIMSYRPDDLTVFVRLRRCDQLEKTIHTWRSRDRPAPARLTRDGDCVVLDVEEEHRLVNGAATQDKRPLQFIPEVNRSKLGSFSCQCSLRIFPSYDEDNEAELSIHVTHPALTSPISVRRTLNVIGVPPKLNAIMAPDHQVHNENVTLTCPINNFKPQRLFITWLKKDKNSQETELITWTPETLQQHNEIYSHHLKGKGRDEDHFCYNCLSALTFKPTAKEDDGVTYICRTFHHATQHRAEEKLTMSLIAFPEFDEIQNTQETVYVGEKLDLNCRIHSFYPKDIKVAWYVVDRELTSVTSDPLEEPSSGLYHVNSKVSYTPTLQDLKKKFRCEVQQKDEKPKYITWTLRELYSEPCLGEIQTDPAEPKKGEPVILSCEFTNMYPGHCNIQWYLGLNRLTSNGDVIKPDSESGMFSGITMQKLETAEHGTTILLEITHNTKTLKKEYKMSLKGFPTLSEITSDPVKGDYGKSLTLRCEVKDCKPADIKKVTWTPNGRLVVSGHESVSETRDMLVCTLTVTLTAEDYGRFYTCSVYHKENKQPFTKNFSIKLSEKPPTLSDIMVHPVMVRADQETSFQVSVSEFSPRDIQVKWYKGFSQFSNTAVTSSEPQIGEDNLYTLSSTLTFTPSKKDDKISIRCEVTHSASRTIREKHYVLILTEKPPTLSDIMVRPEMVRADQEASFIVTVSGFSPRDIQVKWYKGISQFPQAAVTSSDPRIGEDNLYTVTSTLTFTPSEKDDKVSIRCEVTHSASRTIREKRYVLILTGPDIGDAPPSDSKPFAIRKIECLTGQRCVGKKITLVGHVDGCETEHAEFSWYKGIYPIDGEIDNKQVGSGCTSTITFTAEDSDTDCTVKLEVIYNYQTVEKTYNLGLR